MSLIIGAAPRFFGCLHMLEQIGMIAFFDPEDTVTTIIVEGLDMGSIGTQTIFRDDAFEMRMILAQLGNEALAALRSQSFLAVPSGFTIGSGIERNHCTEIRMDNRCAQHLMIVRDRPVAVDLVQTRRTVNRWGGKIPRAIESH